MVSSEDKRKAPPVSQVSKCTYYMQTYSSTSPGILI